MNTRTLFLKHLNSSDTQFIEVGSDKMKDRGINKGDLVAVDHQTKPQAGELAVSERDGKMKIEVATGKGNEGKVVFVVKGV